MLNRYREELDRIDSILIDGLESRMKALEDIAIYKKTHGIPIEDKGRENEKLEKIRELSKPFCAEHNVEIFRAIIEESKKYQKELMEQGEDTV